MILVIFLKFGYIYLLGNRGFDEENTFIMYHTVNLLETFNFMQSNSFSLVKFYGAYKMPIKKMKNVFTLFFNK